MRELSKVGHPNSVLSISPPRFIVGKLKKRVSIIHVDVQNLKGGFKMLIGNEDVENSYFRDYEVLKMVQKNFKVGGC